MIILPEMALKKRSASFYPDGRLRHVGFLGAAPPAVKGLADIGFTAEEDHITFDFQEQRIHAVGRILQRLREFIIEKVQCVEQVGPKCGESPINI